MINPLPIVRPFSQPYEAWQKRQATLEEMLASSRIGPLEMWVNDKLNARISNEYEAAQYMAQQGADNGVEFYIDRVLGADPSYQRWLEAMPSTTPSALEEYQQSYPVDDLSLVDKDINFCGAALGEGQQLFHGGCINFDSNGELVTSKPLSTTLCPQVALREAEWRGKAYIAGQICLYVLRVCASKTNAFVFHHKGSDKGHEKEVLFASGATLRLRTTNLIRSDYRVSQWANSRSEEKFVPIYVCEVDVF